MVFTPLFAITASHTVHPNEPYAMYRTHLHLAAHLFCSSSSQTVHWTKPYAVYRTRLHLAARFFCSPSSQIVNRAETYALHPTRNKNLNRASIIANVLHLFSRVFYTTVCGYGITHSFVEWSLIIVSRLDHPAVVLVQSRYRQVSLLVP